MKRSVSLRIRPSIEIGKRESIKYLRKRFSSASFCCWLSAVFSGASLRVLPRSASKSSRLTTSSTELWLFSPMFTGSSCTAACRVIGWFWLRPDCCGRSLYVPLMSYEHINTILYLRRYSTA